MFIDSIGQVLNRDAIRVRVKVDDNPIVESKGRYPNALTTTHEAQLELLTQFAAGEQARIRTEHGDEQHTFAVSLDGFREAAQWVIDACRAGTNRMNEETNKKQAKGASIAGFLVLFLVPAAFTYLSGMLLVAAVVDEGTQNDAGSIRVTYLAVCIAQFHGGRAGLTSVPVID